MYEYIPTATDFALSVYTNAIIDLKHEVRACERERLLARAQRAWAAFIRCDNPFPGWKLPRLTEPCACCRGRSVVAERGYLYPCAECCTIEDEMRME